MAQVRERSRDYADSRLVGAKIRAFVDRPRICGPLSSPEANRPLLPSSTSHEPTMKVICHLYPVRIESTIHAVQYLRSHRFADPLIGVEDEHPLARGGRNPKVLERSESFEAPL